MQQIKRYKLTQNDRRIQILDNLHTRRFETAYNLAKEFDVSRQTIMSDINALSICNAEIEVKPGRGGGIYIKKGFRSDRKYISPKEIKLIKRLQLNMAAKLTKEDNIIFDTMIARLSI